MSIELRRGLVEKEHELAIKEQELREKERELKYIADTLRVEFYIGPLSSVAAIMHVADLIRAVTTEHRLLDESDVAYPAEMVDLRNAITELENIMHDDDEG